ncbi:hypothetical protein Dtox_2173 [Desulfofarcimen acetoxidans DSM 771]|uniref:Type I restriction modification DNA specificity domain-containing protein n=1 Tax=Desulfofarcimen acetoxidans (strain ATCC 49208 / DSM 771 / KCTC 5769 / VKM B-1644 / 5575) TaxID=485916 RepID=C8VZL7_DESAS|nr:restriction endonuclease subunit S [Desulfofarcimen acetoxidans]ACV62995.1 hypothetical protein Dtox_2173 [Desulfofarcimen acetoxidans DSM 771]
MPELERKTGLKNFENVRWVPVVMMKLINNQPNTGEILFSKDGSPGIAYYIDEKPIKMIPSGGILRLTVKTDCILPEYLTLVLNSFVIRQQMKRDVGGSIILHWRFEQIKNVLIPIVEEYIQRQIKEKVKKAFEPRKKALVILDLARRSIENAIETNENNAISWLNAEVDKLGVNLNG